MDEKATILLVEDDRLLLEGIAELLEVADTGYNIKVLKALNGERGLGQLRQQLPDLIISDIMMPGMNGYEFLEVVRAEPSWVHIPVIFLTAKGTEQDILKGRLSGAELYITKPYESKVLLNLVKGQLDRTFQLKHSHQQTIGLLRQNIVKILNHEFRTPLSYVIAYYELLESGLVADGIDTLHQYLQGIQGGTVRLERLIQDLVAIMELWTGETAGRWDNQAVPIADLDELISRVVQDHSHYELCSEVIYSCDVPAKLPLVFGDVEAIYTILTRLLDNAVKFSAIKSERPIKVDVKVTFTADRMMVAVRDYGIGFPETIRDRIFDLFFQHDRELMEQQGTGAGLTIVKGLVELHGGHIDVESLEDEGSTFTVHLPIYQPKHHSLTVENGDSQGKGKATVLIVEDEKLLLDGLKDLLEVIELGYDINVLTALNGLEGLEILSRQTPDLIISDIMMPRMNGYEFLAQLRKNPAWVRIPVIFLTAKGEAQEVLHGRTLGVQEYISKPYHTSELLSIIVAQLDRHFQRQIVFDRDLETIKHGILDLLETDMGLPLEGLTDSIQDLTSRLDEVGSAEELIVYLRSLETDSRHVTRLVGDFMFLVELSTNEVENKYKDRSRPQEVGKVIGDFGKLVKRKRKDSEIRFEIDLAASQVLVMSDCQTLVWALERLLDALLDYCEVQPFFTLLLPDLYTGSELNLGLDVSFSLRFQDSVLDPVNVGNINDLFARAEPIVVELSELNPGFLVAKSVIDMHNGAIRVNQYDARECSVTVTLPVYSPV